MILQAVYLLDLDNGRSRDYAKGPEYPIHIQTWRDDSTASRDHAMS
jgi:hypothetical protein